MNADPAPFTLNDDQRQRLSEVLSDLPWIDFCPLVAVFEGILAQANAIGHVDATAPAPQVVRDDLKRLHKRTEALFHDLLGCSYEVRAALLDSGWGTGLRRLTGGGDRLLERQITELGSLAQWLARAVERANSPPPPLIEDDQVERTGNRTAASDFLTREVDALMRRHTGNGLTASEKINDPGQDLLGACFRIVGVDVTVTTAIRRLVARRRKSSGRVPAEKS